MPDDNLEIRKIELEAKRLDLERERFGSENALRLAELEEKRAQRLEETERLAADRALKAKELKISSGRGIRFTTGQATVAAAFLSVFRGVIGGLMQAWATRDVEASKSAALIQVEQLKADENIALERQKQEAAERLDRAKFETTLILKATEAPKREDQIRNLQFFLNAGFIQDPQGKLAAIDPSSYPSTPAPEASRQVVLSSVADLPSGSPIRQIAKPVGEIEIGAHPGSQAICTGWLTSRNFVITAAYCVLGDVKNIHFRLGHLSETITGDIYNLVRLVELNKEYGYAILEVPPEAATKYGWIPLKTRDAVLNEEVVIPQFGGQFINGKLVYSPGQLVSNSKCIVSELASKSDDLSEVAKFASFFGYNCGSVAGSAGAPVIALAGNYILGIHAASSAHRGYGIALPDVLAHSEILRQLASDELHN